MRCFFLISYFIIAKVKEVKDHFQKNRFLINHIEKIHLTL